MRRWRGAGLDRLCKRCARRVQMRIWTRDWSVRPQIDRPVYPRRLASRSLGGECAGPSASRVPPARHTMAFWNAALSAGWRTIFSERRRSSLNRVPLAPRHLSGLPANGRGGFARDRHLFQRFDWAIKRRLRSGDAMSMRVLYCSRNVAFECCEGAAWRSHMRHLIKSGCCVRSIATNARP